MLNQIKHLPVTIFSLAAIVVSTTAMSYDKIYYGDGARTVVISSKESTLLIFPSPPIAKVCHPDSVVDLVPIENENELQHMGISQGSDLLTAMNNQQEKSRPQTSNSIDFMLKLSPFQTKASSKCDIRLANRDTVTVVFVTNPDTRRPLVEFESIFKRNIKKEDVLTTEKPLEIFSDFLMGGHLSGFIDTTESHNDLSSKTSISTYTIVHSETDKEKFTLWKIRVVPRKSLDSIPPLRNVRINELHFSSWVNKKSKRTALSLLEDREVDLYIMTMQDTTATELLEKLP